MDTATGARLLTLRPPKQAWRAYSPDGRSFAALDTAGNIAIWDLPPRKPLGWFALAAGVLALPIAWLARRRVRRLRREAA
jgi:hypothetical protein